jgi:MFS family permease
VTLALALFAQVPSDGDYVTDLLPTMVLFGIGGGLGFPALMTIAMSDVAPSDAGLASGLVNTTAQVGGAVGLAVLATLATTRTSDLTAGGDALPAALTGGYHLAFMIGACLMVVAIAIGVFVLRPPKPAPGQAQAEAEHAEGHYSPAETVYSEVS